MKRHDPVPGLPSQRQLRVGEQVRHVLADILQRGEIHDPFIEGHVITVPEVRMSPDLKLATAYVMPLGGKDEAEVVKALNRLARAFRGALAKRLREMRSMPEVRFRLDDRFDAASHIDTLLARPEVARDLAKPAKSEE
ncbi:MAG TPA: 30S ribosome-binding factor RbfA [Beijerinckiaceae bacterium]|nr:30S ribosome-binding factor RbfA [Beijerinckiaceae bacterium]